MGVDNKLYDRLAETWWDEGGLLHLLRALNPARFGYMRRVLLEQLRLAPQGLRVLDVGSGGGLLAEEFAGAGFTVTGVDPSHPSIRAAREHAAAAKLPIDYVPASGENLPFDDGSFDIVYCCDVLEHVRDVSRVIQESARVLKGGGVYLFDTINRTFQSKLVMILLLQEWNWTSVMPPHLHDWTRFIRPRELTAELQQHGLVLGDLRGLKPRVHLLTILKALRARKRARVTYSEAVRRMNIGESPDTSVSYLGYALKS